MLVQESGNCLFNHPGDCPLICLTISYFFCKYLCPQGVLEGAIPLSLTNAGIRAALGKLFTWKACILLAVIVGSVVFYRPFCKWLCPLGAFYALLNKVSLFQMRVMIILTKSILSLFSLPQR